MAQAKPLQLAQAGSDLAKKTEEQELRSVRLLLNLLDKTFRTARTYGLGHQLAQKFVERLHDELIAQLKVCGTLSLLVRRFEFYYQGKVVYQKPSPTENLAFKLYAEGIRELSFAQGLSRDDLIQFLESLGADQDTAGADDEDTVTRLWAKDLSTVSIVTAEQIVRGSAADDPLMPQDAVTLNTPTSRLKEITAAAIAHQEHEKALGGKHRVDSSATSASKTDFRPSLPEYEVSPQELNQLAAQIEAESLRDDSAYLADLWSTILASEQSASLLYEILDLLAEILETLIQAGDWKPLSILVGRLSEIKHRSDLTMEHHQKVLQLLDSLAGRKHLQAMAQTLNANPQTATHDLLAFLQTFRRSAIPSLCGLLGNLKFENHRLTVCEAVMTLAKDMPELLTEGLTDPRSDYVRDLLFIIANLGNPRLADSVFPLAAHRDPKVRLEALRTLEVLRPSGTGMHLIGLLNDSDEFVRLEALNLLELGNYASPFSLWAPIVTHKEFHHRSISEIEAFFQAMSQVVREEAVQYWRQLVTQWLWPQRKKKQEIGALAAEALGRIGSPAAISALEAGKKRLNRFIRNACTDSLDALMRSQQADH